MTDEMKPVQCGCGGEAEVDWVLEPSNCYMANVFCNQCGTKTIPFWSTEKDKAIDYAVTTWNRAMSGNVRECAENARWIPVTEALPKEKEMVLITNKKGHVRCGQYQRTFDDINYRWWWKHKTLEEVLAWMPLPEPWRGDR